MTPTDQLLCAVSNVPLFSYRTCESGHKVHPLLVDCRHFLGIKICPVQDCSEQLTTQMVTELARERFNTQANLCEVFTHCLPWLIDPKTQRIFSSVMQLSCGHPSEDRSLAWIRTYNESKCLSCKMKITCAVREQGSQRCINQVVTQFRSSLGYTPHQNRGIVLNMRMTQKGFTPSSAPLVSPIYELSYEALKMSLLFAAIWVCSFVKCNARNDEMMMMATLL